VYWVDWCWKNGSSDEQRILNAGFSVKAFDADFQKVRAASLPAASSLSELARSAQFVFTMIPDIGNCQARENQYAYVDQELESGLRSIAVPILGSEGQTIAALNVSAQAARVKKSEMVGRYLDSLREAASKISMHSRTVR
jgi:transcriptional regulator